MFSEFGHGFTPWTDGPTVVVVPEVGSLPKLVIVFPEPPFTLTVFCVKIA
jgi:hypothetical protein